MKGLGEEMGFPGKQADSRIAQYESGNKMPRKDVILELTKILDINPTYLVEPDPEYIMGVLQILFEMDRIYDIDLDVDDENVVIKIPKNKEKNYDLALFLLEWIIVLKQKQAGDISQEVYDEWKCNIHIMYMMNCHKLKKPNFNYLKWLIIVQENAQEALIHLQKQCLDYLISLLRNKLKSSL